MAIKTRFVVKSTPPMSSYSVPLYMLASRIIIVSKHWGGENERVRVRARARARVRVATGCEGARSDGNTLP